ncbi:MAG TPA: ATP-binding protein [Streptomyces sp.]|nr:ATP-binding protein [Streptomyces sp.]
MGSTPAAVVTELRLSAFRAHRSRVLPLGPMTLLTGPSGCGKSSALDGYESLARLAGGAGLAEVFGELGGGAAGCVPQRAKPDEQGRRGFRLGCTVDGPAGAVRLDLAVQAEPELRVAGERLTAADGRTLLSTALRDPARPAVQAEWLTGGTRTTRARMPDDRLATVLLPLRISGATDAQREVLTAAEQVVIALRSAFACDPDPAAMRAPVDLTDGLLRRGCGNLAAVLRRTRAECGIRHGLLVDAVRAGCAGPVSELLAVGCEGGRVRAVLERGDTGRRTPVEWLGDGELRYMALALVLMTGPGVLSMDPVEGVLPARQALSVLADGLDRGLDARQSRALLDLAARMCERGHIRLLGTVRGDAPVPEGCLVDLGSARESRTPAVSSHAA